MENTYTENYDTVQFEATYTPTRKIYAEIHWRFDKFNKILGAICGVVALYYIYCLVKFPIPYYAVMAILMTLYTAYGFTAHLIFALRRMRFLKKLNGGSIPTGVYKFGDRICFQDKDNTSYLDYAELKKIRSLKHSYVFVFTTKIRIAITRDTFTKGTFEEFKAFLKENRPDLTIPQ